MTETPVVRKIKDWLNANGGKVIKIRGDGLQEIGTPDLVGAWRGRCVAFEVKYGKNKAEPIQEYRLEQWNKAGAITGVVRSVDDVVAILALYTFNCKSCEGPMDWRRSLQEYYLECRECGLLAVHYPR